MIKAVLFDLGETLLSFGKVEAVKLFREAGVLSYNFLKQTGQPVGRFNVYFWRNLLGLRIKYFVSRITGRDFDSLCLLKKYGLKKGYTLSQEQWEHLNWLWYEPLSKVARVEPDLGQTLARLKEMGLKLAVVSNTFVNAGTLDRHLKQLGLLDYFQFSMYSHSFVFRKPDRRIFVAAAEKIGQQCRDIMFVGDRIDNDIKGAIAVGMQPVLKIAYTNRNEHLPQDVLTINKIRELPELIEKVNSKG